MTMKFAEFDIKHLTFEEVKLTSNKTVILPKYIGQDVPNMRLHNIELTHYGVPKVGRFFPTDKDRMFLQVPLDGALLESFQMLDTFLTSNDMKQKLFKGSANTYTYSPIVKNGIKGPYLKMKLETDYDTGDIVTILWKSTRNDEGNVIRDTTSTHIKSIDDFASAVCLNSTILCVVRLVKIWVINMQYGLTIKLVKVNALNNDKKVDEDDGHDVDFI